MNASKLHLSITFIFISFHLYIITYINTISKITLNVRHIIYNTEIRQHLILHLATIPKFALAPPVLCTAHKRLSKLQTALAYSLYSFFIYSSFLIFISFFHFIWRASHTSQSVWPCLEWDSVYNDRFCVSLRLRSWKKKIVSTFSMNSASSFVVGCYFFVLFSCFLLIFCEIFSCGRLKTTEN